jgi:hypothetical protein
MMERYSFMGASGMATGEAKVVAEPRRMARPAAARLMFWRTMLAVFVVVVVGERKKGKVLISQCV